MTRAKLRFLAVLALWPLVTAARQPFPEHEVKAEWVLRFAEFTEWPEPTSDGGGEPFVIGAVGWDDVAERLAQLAPTRRIHGRPLQVVRVERAQEAGRCHVLWLSSSAREQLPELLRVARGRPVLTVGESEELAGPGVHIVLKRMNDRLAFAINLAECQHSSLRMSPSVLRLAIELGAGRR